MDSAVLSCGLVYYADGSIFWFRIVLLCGSTFWVCKWHPYVWPFKWKLLSSTFRWYSLLCCTRWFSLLSLWMKSYSVTQYSNETYWVELSCGDIYYAVQGGSNFWVLRRDPKVWPFKWRLLSSNFLWCCFLSCKRWTKSQSMTIQMKASVEQCFLSVLTVLCSIFFC